MVRIRTKTCDRCQLSADILYRVRVVGGKPAPVENRSGDWQFVCDACWQLLDRDSPNYIYGGTWKARKR
jgi:hypothetical protein